MAKGNKQLDTQKVNININIKSFLYFWPIEIQLQYIMEAPQISICKPIVVCKLIVDRSRNLLRLRVARCRRRTSYVLQNKESFGVRDVKCCRAPTLASCMAAKSLHSVQLDRADITVILEVDRVGEFAQG
jgi:hypothetical protein